LVILAASIIIFQVIFTDGITHFYKHFGGLISGFLLGFCVSPVYQNPFLEMMKMPPNVVDKKQKIMSSISMGVYALYFGFVVLLINL
jgi:hypothetical protein